MRLILAGGGTGGHIVPNIAIIQEIRRIYPKDKLDILYIGGRRSMEENLMQRIDVDFKGIFCGKLRRYFSLENFFDLFKIPIGIVQAYLSILKFRPDVIFCKGGYASFPVALAGKLARVPVILHESDVVPGLANRMSAKFAAKICISFKESAAYFPNKTVIHTGNPVRKEISEGNVQEGRELTGFYDELPVILIMGGSQGSSLINDFIWNNLGKLLENYQIVHICGDNNLINEQELLEYLKDEEKGLISRYKLFGFVDKELRHFYALCDVVVSRAGAISLAEISAVLKPSVLIPLSKRASRGDQIVNAKAFVKDHVAFVIEEESLEYDIFNSCLLQCVNSEKVALSKGKEDALSEVIKVIKST
jgi:UDP-N-acetylglucosamine--N-acetylmuramyl-(pentapeptide) pyrophosphoryl-undecaprenol N-acetylglucosamine transferase